MIEKLFIYFDIKKKIMLIKSSFFLNFKKCNNFFQDPQ